jgi:hypothetical protein
VAAGWSHCLALKSDGTVVSWDDPSSLPANLSNVVQIAAGSGFSLALKADGTLVYWGSSVPPNGTDPSRFGLSNFTAIACGSYHGLGALGDGSVSINTQPHDLEVAQGARSFLRVAATGTDAIRYQWYLNGSALSLATNSILPFEAFGSTIVGDYRVVASDSRTSVTSRVARVRLAGGSMAQDAPFILEQPADLTAAVGDRAVIGATVSGPPPIAYQWFKNNSLVSGATSPALMISGASRQDSGQYCLVASDSGGSVTSRCARVRIRVPQRLTLTYQSLTGPFQCVSEDADGAEVPAKCAAAFRVQFSTNLVDWADLTHGLVWTNGVLVLRCPVNMAVPQAFFRVVEQVE